MIETIEFEGKAYPAFQASHHASRFILPFAKEVCKGAGYDIGTGKKEWAFPGATIIDPAIIPSYSYTVDDPNSSGTYKTESVSYHAMSLPEGLVDYVFSSHCLEHVKENWSEVLDYWGGKLRPGGILFLYLPHPDQEYWLPWNNEKHVHIIYPRDIERYFKAGNYWTNVFVSERDLNHSFAAMAQKSDYA